MVPSFPEPPANGGRFAPTPTGRLHLGNARTALLAWLDARSQKHRMILRVEDLDPAAMPEGCLNGQYADLDWLGLTYDEGPRVGGPVGPYRQSARAPQYARVLEALNERRLLYPCWCSRKEVRMAATAPHASDEGPVYGGRCRPSKPERLPCLQTLPERNGRRPALRIDVGRALSLLGETHIEFSDRVAGQQSFDIAQTMGDFVVRRVDGIAAYQVACSWDDVTMGCSTVIRGTDLLPSTARQLLLIRVLGLPEPTYGHVGLVLNNQGERLAKRNNAIALTHLRENGVSASSIIGVLAKLSGLPISADLETLTEAYDPSTLSADSVRLPERWRGLQL